MLSQLQTDGGQMTLRRLETARDKLLSLDLPHTNSPQSQKFKSSGMKIYQTQGASGQGTSLSHLQSPIKAPRPEGVTAVTGPVAKSLKHLCRWTASGHTTYFQSFRRYVYKVNNRDTSREMIASQANQGEQQERVNSRIWKLGSAKWFSRWIPLPPSLMPWISFPGPTHWLWHVVLWLPYTCYDTKAYTPNK